VITIRPVARDDFDAWQPLWQADSASCGFIVYRKAVAP
jgi:hypothetical protein